MSKTSPAQTLSTPALHLCIATGQNLANLIPALQCGAREVWVLQTPAMRASAAHLGDALKAHGIAVRRIDFADDAVTALHAQAGSIAEQLDGRAVTINLSGGTKLMTLALVQTLAGQLGTGAQADAPHLVYTDTVHGRLDWLGPTPRSEPMKPVLRIDDILLSQGYRRQGGSGGEAAHWQLGAEKRKTLTQFMGAEAPALAGFFGILNRVSHLALNEPAGPWRPEQYLDFAPGRKPADLLRQARQLGLLTWDDESQLVFHDRDAAQYLGGGWVEEFAGRKISGARGDGRWAPRMLIEHVDSHATNELDAVLVHANRMLVVECKAQRTSGESVADWIYKASQLARSVGGQLAQPLLLSARTLSEEHRQRAREYKVDVLDGAELGRLPDYLRNWMTNG